AEPLHVAEQVVRSLREREPPTFVREQQAPPVQPQDLHSAEGPPEPLLLETLKAQWRKALAERPRLVNAGVSIGQHAQARLGVFRHDVRVPAADLFEGAAP